MESHALPRPSQSGPPVAMVLGRFAALHGPLSGLEPEVASGS